MPEHYFVMPFDLSDPAINTELNTDGSGTPRADIMDCDHKVVYVYNAHGSSDAREEMRLFSIIPKTSRSTVIQTLPTVLDQVAERNDSTSW